MLISRSFPVTRRLRFAESRRSLKVKETSIKSLIWSTEICQKFILTHNIEKFFRRPCSLTLLRLARWSNTKLVPRPLLDFENSKEGDNEELSYHLVVFVKRTEGKRKKEKLSEVKKKSTFLIKIMLYRTFQYFMWTTRDQLTVKQCID